MSFYQFKDEDIIYTKILAYPSSSVELNGNAVTGSVYLEKPYLSSILNNRMYEAFSLKEGANLQKNGPFTASIDIVDAEDGATNKQLYASIVSLYGYYSLFNSDYTPDFTGSATRRFRVVTIPEVYFDNKIASGTIVLRDLDNVGDDRILYDNGNGGIYSGSVSGTLVGNIFYSEGLVVLKGGGLNDEVVGNDFGQSSPTNFKWQISLKGVHTIPVKIFRCRAPAGQLNASTNSTYYHIQSGTTSDNRNEKERVLNEPITYITTIGLYNENYELVGLAKLAQPIKKEQHQDILFRLKIDF